MCYAWCVASLVDKKYLRNGTDFRMVFFKKLQMSAGELALLSSFLEEKEKQMLFQPRKCVEASTKKLKEMSLSLHLGLHVMHVIYILKKMFLNRKSGISYSVVVVVYRLFLHHNLGFFLNLFHLIY